MFRSRLFNILYHAPALVAVVAVSFVWLVTITVFYFVRVPIEFQYAQQSCAARMTPFPFLLKSSDDQAFRITFGQSWQIGDVPIIAWKSCVQPIKAPIAGTYEATASIFGQSWLSQRLSVAVPQPPVTYTDELFGKTIPTTRALEIKLSSPDIIYDYTLVSNDQAVACEPNATALHCDTPGLSLKQGKEYRLSLQRVFQDDQPVEVASGTVTTLQPLKLTKSSVSDDQTVYDKPTELRLTFDKPLTGAAGELHRVTADSREAVDITTTIDQQTAIVSFAEQLPREASFELTMRDVVAADGSTTDGTPKISFHTSGGPKVIGTSIGDMGVDPNQRITVTFDQPLHKDVDITKFAHIVGVPAVINQISDTQVMYTLQNANRCTPFSLQVDKGIPSGSNDAVSKETWTFNSRVICGTSSVIGYSVLGRPIIAYYFGSGSRTILFTGGIHGEELSGYLTMQGWVNYMQSYAHELPADTQVVIVPNTNPDGIAKGQRYNAHNVNLDRNFPTANWSASIDTSNGTLSEGGGTGPASEPETKALMSLTRTLRPRLEVSFHAQGSLVGANKVGNSVSVGSTYASMVGYGTMFYNPEEVMGYSITGEYEDWMAEELGAPAILIELPTHSGNYFSTQVNALLMTVGM